MTCFILHDLGHVHRVDVGCHRLYSHVCQSEICRIQYSSCEQYPDGTHVDLDYLDYDLSVWEIWVAKTTMPHFLAVRHVLRKGVSPCGQNSFRLTGLLTC